MIRKIKKCPFCGMSPKLYHSGGDKWCVYCNNEAVCMITPCTECVDSKAKALEYWNRRFLDTEKISIGTRNDPEGSDGKTKK